MKSFFSNIPIISILISTTFSIRSIIFSTNLQFVVDSEIIDTTGVPNDIFVFKNIKRAQIQQAPAIVVEANGSSLPKVFVLSNPQNDHWTNDGIDGSSLMIKTNHPSSADIWVVNMGDYPCHNSSMMFPQMIKDNLRLRRQRHSTYHSGNNNIITSTHWKIYLMDSADFGYGNRDYRKCLNLVGGLVGPANVYYARRYHHLHRNLSYSVKDDEGKPFGTFGTSFEDGVPTAHNGFVRILRYGVRTDFVNAAKQELFGSTLLSTNYNISWNYAAFVNTTNDVNPDTTTTTSSSISNNDKLFHEALFQLSRPKDVVHYWPRNRHGTGRSLSKQQLRLSSHRQRVSSALYELGDHHHRSHRHSHSRHHREEQDRHQKKNKQRQEESPRLPLETLVDFIGSRGRTGRNIPQQLYIQSMFQFKIVVVAQKDRWEGHYRLMEALCCSGALVLTDPMDPLPFQYQNGTNIIVYNSIRELKHYAAYYSHPDHEEERIQVAELGQQTAMQYHRSWQIMDRLVFGNWSSEKVI